MCKICCYLVIRNWIQYRKQILNWIKNRQHNGLPDRMLTFSFICPDADLAHFHCNFINTLRPRQNGRHFADDIFKWIFLNENVWIPIKFSLKFVPQGPINNIPALVQIMAWRRSGDKPLIGPMMARLPTYICVTQPQWVKTFAEGFHCWQANFNSIDGLVPSSCWNHKTLPEPMLT